MNQAGDVTIDFSAYLERNLKSVVNDLSRLVDLTEQKYGYIYETLPAIERDVKLGVREVELLLNHLIYKIGRADRADQSITVNTLDTILADFEEVTNSFLNEDLVAVMKRTFLDNTGEDKQSFFEMMRVAREVEETLSVLRDLALNSIIFSIRIGEAGAGFQILSDMINQVSLDLGSHFKHTKETINSLNEWNEEFQKSLTEFISYEEDLKSKYQDRFTEEFRKIAGTLEVVCRVLEDNLSHTTGAFNDVGRIMVMIQNQDIVRQNIENVAKCLNIILEKRDALAAESREKQLDYVVFANQVLGLSGNLMDNIESSLNESILGLGEVLETMGSSVSELEEEACQLVRLFAGREPGGDTGSVLAGVFTSVLGQVDDLMDIKKHVEMKSGLLLQSKQNFSELMEKVENDFETINKAAKTLKKMKVLIKIELARIDTEGDFTLNSIISAVDQVIDTINSNRQVFVKLRGYFMKNFDMFNDAIVRTRNKFGLSGGTLTGNKRKLEITRDLARGAVLASHSEMREIFNHLRQPARYLADTAEIENLIAEARGRVAEAGSQTARLQDELFSRYGISQWDQKEDDLKLLMEQFTCFMERKALNCVAGSQLDDIGSEGGDIVLF